MTIVVVTRTGATREDLAWAAGLFEGEGCITIGERNATRRRHPICQLNMADEDVVRRLHTVLGVGTVRMRKYQPVKKDQWVWRVSSFEDAQYVIAALWNWLGARRKNRALEVLTATAETQYFRKHVIRPGMTFGGWRVLAKASPKVYGKSQIHTRWLCRCVKCNSEHVVDETNLVQRKGSCRACYLSRSTKHQLQPGQEFGRWTTVEYVVNSLPAAWKCRCSCGTERDINIYNLIKGMTKSCGCLRRERAATLYRHVKAHA